LPFRSGHSTGDQAPRYPKLSADAKLQVQIPRKVHTV
jgi:hypothetical protein